MGEFAIPQVVTFQSIAASVARVHRIWDEAMKASMENARFMINDLTVSECIEQRQRSCALLNWHLEVDNPRDTRQRELSENLTKIVENIPYFVKFRESLLEAIWLGKSVVQWRYGADQIYGVKPSPGKYASFVIPEWLPIHGDKIVFRYDDGSKRWDPHQIGIRVGAGYGLGDTFRQKALGLGEQGADITRKIETTDYGLAYFLEPFEHQNLAVHKHLIRDGEFEDVQSTGKIHGIGIRSRIYWAWYQKQECLAFMIEFLERSALGLEIWYYPWGNPDAEAQTRTAAQERIGQGRNIVLMPRPVDENTGSSPFGVEKLEPGMAGLNALQDVVQNYFGAQIKRYILGQTLTTEAQATGLGSNLATIHLDTYLQIVKYDAVNLEETLTKQLVDRLKVRNYPELRSIPVRFKIDTESADAESKLQAIQAAYEMGLKIRAQDVMDLIGIAKPEKDDEALINPAIEQAKQQIEQGKQQMQMQAQQMEMQAQQAAMGMQAPAQVQGGLGEEEPAEAQEPEGQNYAGTGTTTTEEPAQFSLSEANKENCEPEQVEATKYSAQPSDRISKRKAEEMLKNPPHGKALTTAQHNMLEAAAHKYEAGMVESNAPSFGEEGEPAGPERYGRRYAADGNMEGMDEPQGGGRTSPQKPETPATGGKEESLTAKEFAARNPPSQGHSYVYRVQPAGKGIIGHRSMTSADEPDLRGIHVYGSLNEAREAPKSWMKQKWIPELLTLRVPNKAVKDNGDYEGYVIKPEHAEVVHRQPFKSWNHFLSDSSFNPPASDRGGPPSRYSLSEHRQKVSAAAEATHTDPSKAQIEAGNYRKGSVRLHGMTIRIENPKGTVRHFKSGDSPELPAHYGYIQRVDVGDTSMRPRGRDKEHVDCWIAGYPDSEIVFVIDQETAGGRFDEHKVVLAARSKEQARSLYLAAYPPGWRCGPITAMTMEQFKRWLIGGDKTRRLAPQVTAKYAGKEDESWHKDPEAKEQAEARDKPKAPAWVLARIKHDVERLAIVPDQHRIIGVVMGRIVKVMNFDKFKAKDNMNIVEGANHQRYPHIVPDGEVWVDENLEVHEWKPVAEHEVTEDYEMSEMGLGYDEAHDDADEEEHELRDPGEPERHVDEEAPKPSKYALKYDACFACGCSPCGCHVFTPQWAEETRSEIDAILV